MANPFTITPLGGFNLGGAIAQLGQQFGEQKRRDEQMMQEQEFQSLLKQAYETGDQESIAEVFSMNPQIGQFLAEREDEKVAKIGAENLEQAKQAEIDWGLRWKQATTPEQKEALKQEALTNPLIDIDEEDLGVSGQQADLGVDAMLFGHLGKDQFKALGLGPQEPQEKEPSLPAETVAFNELIKDFTPEQKKSARLVKAGLKGRAVQDSLMTAIQAGEIENVKQAKAAIKQAEKFAEATGSSRAKIIDTGFDKINKINTAIGNIDRAISALDKGAGTGAVERLWPSIKSASVELDNIRGSMALDVVGATTFGALSEGELNLAKDVALPTGLNEPELKDYLQRKKVAQEKLRDYYNEQIQHLDQGGTVASFLRMKERDAQQGGKLTQEQYDALPDGAEYEYNGVKYIKGR